MKGLMIKAALLTALFSSSAMAWDCTNPANWSLNVPGNECYHKGPNPNPPAPTTSGNSNTNQNSNTNNASAGAAAIAAGVGIGVGTGGKSASNSTATGGAATAQGGTSNATGGKGGKATSNAAGGAGGAGGTGGAGGSSTQQQQEQQQQKQSADNAGNSQITNYNSPRIPVNTAIAGIGMTTAGCRFAEGLGVQGTAAAASIGFSFKDKDCSRFQLAQYLYSRGQNEAGDKVMCEIKLIKQALGSDCLTVIAIIPPSPVLEVPPGALIQAPVYPPGESERRQHAHGFPNIVK